MIEVKNLNKTYDRGRPNANHVLKDISISLPDKGFVCILGPSGCGKTSLLNAIGGLDRFDSGVLSTGSTAVKRYGTALYEAERNRSFGYIFQNYYLLPNHSVGYNVYLGLHSLDLSRAEKLRRVEEALEAVDMARFLRRKVSDLSGGQQQRIAIARALARRPRVIFADEPTGNLDEANTRNICTLLRRASRHSLVLMVTHEEHIARFFADRIITLDQGTVSRDSDSWDRSSLGLQSDKQLYTGDFSENTLTDSSVRLRLLQAQDAAPVELTVVAMKDRIILKLSDSRTAMLSDASQPPELIEGKQPVLTLEALERDDGKLDLFAQPPAPQTKAGRGLTGGMLAREARHLMGGMGLKKLGMRVFLVLLTVLTMLTVADFITLSYIDPQDFITTDSHMLVVKLDSGSVVSQESPPYGYTWEEYYQREYQKHIEESGLDFDFIPLYSQPPKYALNLLYQMGTVSMQLPAFSYVPLERLNESDLAFGRMPQTGEEVVIDRILLDAMLEADGVVQNSIDDLSALLGEQLDYGSKGLNPTIVGISDSGERALYADKTTLLALGNRSVNVITLSQLRGRFPGQYDDLTLEPMDCIVNTANAGTIWSHRIGQTYGSSPNIRFAVATIDIPDILAHIIVTDESVDSFIKGTLSGELHLYCADKAAMKRYLAQKTEWETENRLRVTVSDPYAEKYAAYAAAASVKANARTIVTATVLLISIVMLYLLGRAQAQERIGMLAVYRLLGIPGSKAAAIFALESLLTSLMTIVPAGLMTYLAVQVGITVPEIGLNLVLPFTAAAAVIAAIAVYHLLVSLLPALSLLRLPPAQLAAKYDI